MVNILPIRKVPSQKLLQPIPTVGFRRTVRFGHTQSTLLDLVGFGRILIRGKFCRILVGVAPGRGTLVISKKGFIDEILLHTIPHESIDHFRRILLEKENFPFPVSLGA